MGTVQAGDKVLPELDLNAVRAVQVAGPDGTASLARVEGVWVAGDLHGYPVHFEDLESGEKVPVVPERQREQYRQLVRTHLNELSRLLAENRMDYYLFDTSKPLDHALFAYLSRRERLSRVR